jgi:hypothetical protein
MGKFHFVWYFGNLAWGVMRAGSADKHHFGVSFLTWVFKIRSEEVPSVSDNAPM